MTIRLLIADDHELVRSGLAVMLEGTEIEIVAQATTADEAFQLATEHRPDVVLLDIRMPPRDGILVIEQIREACEETQVVVFSTYDNPTYVARSVALGASDYVLKGASRHQLTTAILRAARGRTASGNEPSVSTEGLDGPSQGPLGQPRHPLNEPGITSLAARGPGSQQSRNRPLPGY